MRTRIWHSDWKPRWLIRCVSAALLSFMDKQEAERDGRIHYRSKFDIDVGSFIGEMSWFMSDQPFIK